MPNPLQSLLTTARQTAEEEARIAARKTARAAWAKKRIAALKAAQKRADQAWERLVRDLPEHMDDEDEEAFPPPPEQAAVDAIWAEIKAVVDHDKWPREMHWKDV